MVKIVRKNIIIPILLSCLQLLFFSSIIQAQTDTTIIIQENETGIVSYDGSIDSDNAGFTGDGFINTDNNIGMGITWEICAPASSSYKLQWRYANGTTSNRTARVMVNGSEVVSNVDFQLTGAWTTWDTTLTVAITLESGPNQIRLEATNVEGLANIDYISVTGSNPSAGFCPVLVTGVSISLSATTVGVKGFKQLSASVLPANATNQSVIWSSGDTTIATVSSTGLVAGVKEGSADIIVTTEEGSFTDTCIVTALTVPVYFLETSVSGEGSVIPTSDSIAEGSIVCITATPATGWIFDGWSGDTNVTDNPVCITIDTNKSITANFSETPYDYIIGFGKQSVDGYAGYNGTTGGGTTTPVIVTTASEFISAVGNDNPAVIVVHGRLNVGTISIGSNKTIAGFDENAGLYGGTIKIQRSNYIIQNLTIGPADADVMEVSGATNVFITKCAFHDAGDEILSIVRQADYVTVSWCKFYFDNTHSHAYGHLIGNGDGVIADRGKLHVTMHHNWYAYGIVGRQPRVRYGHVHIYNNYYNSVVGGYCIGVGYECHIRIENIHFEGVSAPWADYGGVVNGEIGWNNLKFVSCSQPTFVKNSFPVYNLPYSYVSDPVDSVKKIVMAKAGNVFDAADTIIPILVSVTAPSDNDDFENNANIIIEADASVSEGTITSVQFFQNYTLIGVSTNSPYFLNWENVPAGNYKITAKAIDNKGKSTFSDIINITVREEVNLVNQEDLSLKLYPNPVSNDLIIQLKGDLFDDACLTLYDSFGNTIIRDTVKGNEHRMNLSSIPEGIYIISLTSKKGNIVRKFVKK